MTQNEIEFIRCMSAELLDRMKAYENILVPYSLRVDLRVFLEQLSKIK